MNPAMIDELWKAARENPRGAPILVTFARLLRAEVRRHALQQAAFVLRHKHGDERAAGAVEQLLAEEP